MLGLEKEYTKLLVLSKLDSTDPAQREIPFVKEVEEIVATCIAERHNFWRLMFYPLAERNGYELKDFSKGDLSFFHIQKQDEYGRYCAVELKVTAAYDRIRNFSVKEAYPIVPKKQPVIDNNLPEFPF